MNPDSIKYCRYAIERYSQNVLEPILDVGCGTETSQFLFPDMEWMGMDINPNSNATRIENIEDTTLPDSSIGTVLCFFVFEHLKDPLKGANQIHRILKTNGLLVLSVPFAFFPHDPTDENGRSVYHDYWRYTPLCVRDILFAKFRVLEVIGLLDVDFVVCHPPNSSTFNFDSPNEPSGRRMVYGCATK